MPRLTPEDARLELLIERLGRGKQTFHDFVWPGGTLMVRLRKLTDSEVQLATAAAVKRFADIGFELIPEASDDFANEIVVQRLWRGLEDPSQPFEDSRFGRCAQLYASADDFRAVTQVEERSAVFDEYCDLAEDTDPAPARLDAKTLSAIEDAVKKKDERALRGYGSSTLRAYLLTTDSPPESSPTGKSGSTA
jgi:hypothetical protein